jgi:hypothetical protein
MATNRIASSFIHEQNDRLITASAITNNATEDVELADPKDDTESAEKERKRIRGLFKKLIIQLVVFTQFFCILWDSFEVSLCNTFTIADGRIVTEDLIPTYPGPMAKNKIPPPPTGTQQAGRRKAEETVVW